VRFPGGTGGNGSNVIRDSMSRSIGIRHRSAVEAIGPTSPPTAAPAPESISWQRWRQQPCTGATYQKVHRKLRRATLQKNQELAQKVITKSALYDMLDP